MCRGVSSWAYSYIINSPANETYYRIRGISFFSLWRALLLTRLGDSPDFCPGVSEARGDFASGDITSRQRDMRFVNDL